MSVPPKYRAIGDFHEYYSGTRKAPYLTLFVGGNHEASSHLQELYYGGWVAPNIYYLGAANVIRFGDLRIAGLSGIWKGYNYNKAHFERLPYSEDETKSIYHVREIDVRKLLQLRTPVDMGLSHDWPRGVEWHGNWKALFKKKDLFEADARAGTLGSSAAKYVMDRLRPAHWFSAHLHCKFAALVQYDIEPEPTREGGGLLINGDAGQTDMNRNANEMSVELKSESTGELPPSKVEDAQKNNDEIDLDMSDDEKASNFTPTLAVDHSHESETPALGSAVASDIRSQLPAAFSRVEPTSADKSKTVSLPPAIVNKRVQFLALDKCLSNRHFLQVLDIEPSSSSNLSSNPPRLTYDKEWLAILRVFAAHDPHQPNPTSIGEAAYAPLITKEEDWVEQNLLQRNRMEVPENFEITAPQYDGKAIGLVGREQPTEYTNSQTKAFCDMLQIPNWFDESDDERRQRRMTKTAANKSERMERGSRGGGRGGGRGRGGGGGRGRGRGGRGRGFR
ncbi:hypothetical protein MMC21_003676 [Puttea exsequens]|nr:hypothetical protein [Puttea exsequens]